MPKMYHGNRLFTEGTKCKLHSMMVQSYFSRQAGKLRHQHAEDDGGDHEAAGKLEQQQYWETYWET